MNINKQKIYEILNEIKNPKIIKPKFSLKEWWRKNDLEFLMTLLGILWILNIIIEHI